MTSVQKLQDWVDDHRDVAIDLLRIYLGVGLFVRGVLFFYDPSSFTALIGPAVESWMTAPVVIYAIAFIHLAGGALMAVGYLTRLAALVQMPILVGAVFVAHLQGGLFTANQSFEFSALVLFMLILVFVNGSGRWSLDQRWGRQSFMQPFDSWVTQHQDITFDLLRVYLGIGLFVRGILFISDSAAFMELLGPTSGSWLTSAIIVHYVALAHLFGGALMAIGLLTRIAALVQLPALIGAVFVAQIQGGLLTASQSFEFAVLVLFLLSLVFLYGSGDWSADYYIFQQPAEPEPEPVERTGPVSHAMRMAADRGPAEAEGDVLTVPQRAKTETRTKTCTCGYDRNHPQVVAHARYNLWAMFYFLAGITAPPKEIVFVCEECGTVVERSRDPEDLRRYRYQT